MCLLRFVLYRVAARCQKGAAALEENRACRRSCTSARKEKVMAAARLRGECQCEHREDSHSPRFSESHYG